MMSALLTAISASTSFIALIDDIEYEFKIDYAFSREFKLTCLHLHVLLHLVFGILVEAGPTLSTLR